MKKGFTLLVLVIFIQNFALTQKVDLIVVSPENPVKRSDTALRKKLLEWSTTTLTLTPNKLNAAHPSSVNFPGAAKVGFELKSETFHFIHKKADSSQYNISKKFIASYPNLATWYSTGLYAVAGQPIFVRVPTELYKKQIYLIIGAHSDYLGLDYAANEDWRRMPGVFSAFVLDSNFRFASSPFGGLIYLAMAPQEADVETELTFKKVVRAPYYQLGSTTIADWKKQLTLNKAPWGEIASDKVIITLPDSALQKLENPEEVLRQWDKILSCESDLGQLPAPFIRPMRMVVDEHIAAGFMHSGYPIMILHSPSQGMLSLDIITNPAKLLLPSNGGANWGFFHEIGHNLQNLEWLFDGTGEVTCNLFALYVFDSLIKTRKGAHGNIEPAYQKKLMQEYFAKGSNYKNYQEDPFLALIPFMQVQKQFDWDPFKKAFKWYLEHPSHDFDNINSEDSLYKKANQIKINRFVERLSIEVKRSLVSFFRIWGVPVDTFVDEKLKKYKLWIPEELKVLEKKN